MKKIIISALCAVVSIEAQATFTYFYKLDNIPIRKIIDHEPLVGEWLDEGSARNCLEWTPKIDSVKKGESFKQTSECDQDKKRITYEQVKEAYSGEVYKTGKYTEEFQTVKVTREQQLIGTREKKCVFNTYAVAGGGFWIEDHARKTSFISWFGPEGGKEQFDVTVPSTAGYERDGFIYTMGNKWQDYYETSYHYVCRE